MPLKWLRTIRLTHEQATLFYCELVEEGFNVGTLESFIALEQVTLRYHGVNATVYWCSTTPTSPGSAGRFFL